LTLIREDASPQHLHFDCHALLRVPGISVRHRRIVAKWLKKPS